MSSSESESDESSRGPTPESELTIVPNGNVLNITYYESSTDDSEYDSYSDGELDSEEELDGEVDEESKSKLEFLEDRLGEIASINVTGKSCFRIMFLFKKGVNLKKATEKCDFDHDEEKLPVMVLGGEDFLLPYMKLLCKKKKFLTPLQITTNCSGKKKYSF